MAETTEETTEQPTSEEVEDNEVVIPEGAQNPDAVRNAIRNERKAAREANARARELEAQIRERESREKPLEAQLAEQRELLEAAQLSSLRYQIAAEAGLDISLAPRLVGMDREALLADAEAFKGQIGTPPPAPPATPPEGGPRHVPSQTPQRYQGGRVDIAEMRENYKKRDKRQADREGGEALAAVLNQQAAQSSGNLFAGRLEPAPADE